MVCFLTICAGAGYNMVAVLYVFVFLAAVLPLDQTIWLAAIVCNWVLIFILSPMLMVDIFRIYVFLFYLLPSSESPGDESLGGRIIFSYLLNG